MIFHVKQGFVIRNALHWVITRRVLVITDVSGQPIASIFRCQEFKILDLWKLDLILLQPFSCIITSCFYIVLFLYMINLCTNYVHMFVLNWTYLHNDGVRIWIMIFYFVRTEVWDKDVVNQWKKSVTRSLAMFCTYICNMMDKFFHE
jgi:hypothetical protein